MFNPDIHHRRSIRLRNFDYSANGAYFVTICTEKHECRFVGANPCVRPEFKAGKMVLNKAGKMVKELWLRLPEKFPSISLGEFVIMPNHFHGIIILHDADRRGEPMCSPAFDVGSPAFDVGSPAFDVGSPAFDVGSPAGDVGSPAGDQIQNRGECRQNLGEHRQNLGEQLQNLGEHVVRPYGTMENSLGRVMQAFKTMTTNAYIRGVKQSGWPPFHGRLWQRNYYERIIRDDQEMASITEYIALNPIRWADDRGGEPRVSPNFTAPDVDVCP